MTSVVPPSQAQQNGHDDHSRDPGLPLRWALILVASLAAGFAVNAAVGMVPGITVGFGLAGLLHRIVSKR